MIEEQTRKFKDTVKDDESLKLLMKRIEEFNAHFCLYMLKGSDFTLRLEARGNKGEVLHIQTNITDREAPAGAQKRIDNKSNQK